LNVVNKQLTVHNAEIRTATVEIRTLTLSGKQVTLAVFRQLVEERLFDEAGNLSGVPWGTVNYHFAKRCDDLGVHHHVVWQCGSDLRRATVGWPYVPTGSASVPSGEAWLAAAILAGSAPPNLTSEEVYAGLELETTAGPVCIASRRRDIHEALSPRADWATSATTRLEAITSLVDHGADVEWQWRRVEAEVAEDYAARERLQKRWAEVLSLPQLFIAV
jgi:hypothetical protein